MPDKKLTDNEIVKALECCKTNEECKECAFKRKTYCIEELCDEALDLINRQKEEIEGLNKEVDRLSQVVLYNDGVTEMKVDEAKAEALKKAASKFAGHSDYHGDTILCELYCMAEGKEVGNAKPLDMSEIKAEAYKEFAGNAVERVEKAKLKYQRLCKEQGEEMEEHMHIHFNGIIKIINNLLKELESENK